MKDSASKTIDFTKGDMTKSVARFALPLLCANLVQLLYSAADALFAGNVVGTAGIAAIGASSLAVTCVVSFLSGFSVGSNVLMASKCGAQDKVALYDNVASCLRGVGDSKTPLYAQIVGGVANVVLDAVALIVFGLGVDGVAWATFISQGAAFLFAFLRARALLGTHAAGLTFRLSFKIAKDIVVIGFPVAIQALCVTLSNALIQAAINATGEVNVAAFTAYFKIETLIYAPLVALGQTTTVLAAQNVGAQYHWRVHLGVRRCVISGTVFAVAAAALLLVFRFQVVALFDSNVEVMSAGGLIMLVAFPFYWIYSFIEVYAGACRGIGKAKQATLITLICFVAMRLLLLAFVQNYGLGLEGVAAIYPATWLMAALLLGAYYYGFAHKGLHPAPHGGCRE